MKSVGLRELKNRLAYFMRVARAGERARRPFPAEPLRALHALHLACALEARAHVTDLSLLSLEARIRLSGELLGFRVLPA